MTTDRRPSDRFCVTLSSEGAAEVNKATRLTKTSRISPLADDARVHTEPAQHVTLALLHKLDLLAQSRRIRPFP